MGDLNPRPVPCGGTALSNWANTAYKAESTLCNIIHNVLSWCDREDSNLWPSGSENYDAARNLMICCTFLLVLHCSATPITSNIKQCANDKNRPPAAKITAGGQLVVKKWSMRARYGAAFCLTVSPFHSGSRHNPLFAEVTGINAIYQFPIGQSFAQGNSDKEVI